MSRALPCKEFGTRQIAFGRFLSLERQPHTYAGRGEVSREPRIPSDQGSNQYILQSAIVEAAGAIAKVVDGGHHDVFVVASDSVAWKRVLACPPSMVVAAVPV